MKQKQFQFCFFSSSGFFLCFLGTLLTFSSISASNQKKNAASDSLFLQFSHQRNFYSQPFQLKITVNHPQAKIFYTTDCTTPSASHGKEYKIPVSVDSTMIIKAIAFNGLNKSAVYTQSFLFIENILKQPLLPKGFPAMWGGSSIIPADYEMDPAVVKNPIYSKDIREAFLSVPSLSLTMSIIDWFDPVAGLYVGYPNSEISREKAIHAEFIYPDAAKNFLVACGLQNQGGTSIVNWKVPKQSMRLLFKEEYGPTRLRTKLFDDSQIRSINTLVVDAFLYGWVHPFDSIQRKTSLFFRDQLCSDLQNKMGWLSFHGMYINLFINGLYWGMYDLHERPDEAFLSEYFNEAEEEFEILKHNPNTIVQGTGTFYNQMLEQARKGFPTKEYLKPFSKYIDFEAYIDYMILNFYLGNFDWAHQNYYAGRNAANNEPFRFYTWDAEHVMRYSDLNYNNTLKNDKGGPTEIHTFLRQNEEYRMMFADAVYKHCFNDGALTPRSFEESFNRRKNEIDKIVILESARWGDFLKKSTKKTYTKNDHWLPEVNKVISEYIPKRRDVFISQLKNPVNKLFPEVMPPLIQEGTNKAVILVNPNSAEGEIFYTLDGSDPRAAGGAIKGAKYQRPLSVEFATVLKSRFMSRNTGEWSALAEKYLLPNNEIYGNELTISEIMYHPEDGYPEYIEIMNVGKSSVNLKGFTFEDGISFQFRNESVLQPGAGLVLTSDTQLFRKCYNFSSMGQFAKRLSRQGETLILKNNFKQTIDSVSYRDSIPWPKIPDEGYSIELSDMHSDNALSQNWKVASRKNGTPFKSETKLDFTVSAYPNPFSNRLNLKIDNLGLASGLFKIDVFNITGNLINSMEKWSYNSEIDVDEIKPIPGMYFIKVTPLSTNQFESQVVKVMKLK